MYVLFKTKEEAEAFQAKVDLDKGYPKEGVNIGPGIHVSKEEGMTLHEYDIRKSKIKDEWAHNVEGIKAEVVGAEIPKELPADYKVSPI